MAVVFFIVLAVVVGFHFGAGICPTNCKAEQTCDADDTGCPECNQTYYGRQCQHRMECRFTAKGAEYRGLRNTTNNGRTCQRWDSQSPHSHHLGLDQEENYCRNPDKGTYPWCYTTNHNVRWEFCDVKMCNTQCPSPPLNAPRVDVTNPPSDGFAVGFNAVIGCMTGYETTGSPATVTVTCQSSLKWTQATLPTCNKVKCPKPLLANSKVSNPKSEYKYKDSITIVCDTGYTLQGQSTLTCQADKSWSPSLPTCNRVKCRQPPMKANSKVSDPKVEYEYQESVTILCDVGYFLPGQNSITCQADASWKPLIPACVKEINCIDLKLSSNVVISSPKKNKYKYNDKVSFQCEEGFKLSHTHDLVCQADKSWDKEEPFCFEICNGLSTPQWIGVTVGSNIVNMLLAIVVTVLIMHRFIARDKKNDNPPASTIRTRNTAFNEYDAIDVSKKEEPHIYNLPEKY